MRKKMYLIPAGIIVFILFFTVFGERGLLRIFHLNKDRKELLLKAEHLRTENERLKREVEALKGDQRYLESIARRDLGLVRPNETIYRFSVSSDAAKPADQRQTQSGTAAAIPAAPTTGHTVSTN